MFNFVKSTKKHGKNVEGGRMLREEDACEEATGG